MQVYETAVTVEINQLIMKHDNYQH